MTVITRNYNKNQTLVIVKPEIQRVVGHFGIEVITRYNQSSFHG